MGLVRKDVVSEATPEGEDVVEGYGPARNHRPPSPLPRKSRGEGGRRILSSPSPLAGEGWGEGGRGILSHVRREGYRGGRTDGEPDPIGAASYWFGEWLWVL